MATLNTRNLPDETHRELRLLAARRHRSMEAEARAILAEACRPRKSIDNAVREVQAWVDQLYGANKPPDVVGDLIRERREEAHRE